MKSQGVPTQRSFAQVFEFVRATAASRIPDAREPFTQAKLSPSEIGDFSREMYRTFHCGHAKPMDTSPRVRDASRKREFEAKIGELVPQTFVERKFRRGSNFSGKDVTIFMFAAGREFEVRVPRELVQEEDAMTVSFQRSAHRPRVSPGFYYVEGTQAPPLKTSQSDADKSRLWRIYFGADNPMEGLARWGEVLKILERNRLAYSAKILSDPSHYPRLDAIVVYLDQDSLSLALDGLIEAHSLPLSSVGTSSFVLPIAALPAVGIAEEPDDSRSGYKGLSFGEHRSRLLVLAMHGLLNERDLNQFNVSASYFWANEKSERWAKGIVAAYG